MNNQNPEDPEFISNSDEWSQDPKAVVAQSAEQLPCKQQVEGSIPSDSTTLVPVSHQRYLNVQAQIQDQEECLEIYEGVLRAIASITKIETPADQSAEAFFFVASKMRKLAIAALQKTGAWR